MSRTANIAAPDRPAATAAIEQSSQDEDCGRWAKRKSSHALVNIQIPELSRTISCMMRNSSSTGALLEAAREQGDAFSALPDEFSIFLPMDRISIPCRLVWRQFRQIGVQYTGPSRVVAKPAPPPRVMTPAKKSLLARVAAKAKR
jgi:hypothetical protein